MRRSAAVATVVRGSERVQVYSVHLPSPLAISGGSRREQLRVLAQDAAKSPDPVLIAGDFNSYGKLEELERAGLVWLTRDLGDTTRVKLLGIPITSLSYDHFARERPGARPGVPALGVVSDNHDASDHLPIWALLVPSRSRRKPDATSRPAPGSATAARTVDATRERGIRCATPEAPRMRYRRACSCSCCPRRRLLPEARAASGAAIPLPEHPRPDLERAEWLNLNGEWAFRFDKDGAGERERWFEAPAEAFPLRIQVPFPWGSKLSGVADEADVAWYARTVRVPQGWQGKRVFLVVGASDWKTSGWLDGEPIGEYQGGYTPFELELTTAREARRGPAARAARGRHAPRLQAGGQAGVREGARPVADGLPGGAARALPGLVRVPPERRAEARRAARAAERPGTRGRRTRAAGSHRRSGRCALRRGARWPSPPERGRRVSRCRSGRARGSGRWRTRTSTTRRSCSARPRARTG